MRSENSPIFSQFQRQVFESKIQKANSSIINNFFSSIKLSFLALTAIMKLDNTSISTDIRVIDKDQRKKEINTLFRAVFNPNAVLTQKDIAQMKVQDKAEEWLNKQLKNHSFKDLEKILKGNSATDLNKLQQTITTAIEEKGVSPLNSVEIKDIIYSKAEEMAQKIYLIDPESIKILQGTRNIKEINRTAQAQWVLSEKSIPEMKVPVSILEKRELAQLQSSLSKKTGLLIKSNKNPELLKQLQADLSLANDVLGDWENRANVRGKITIPSGKQQISKIGETKIKALEIIRDQLIQDLKTKSGSKDKLEVAAKLREVRSILAAKANQNKNQKAHTEILYRQFLKISPLQVDLKELALIPSNDNNNQFLAKAWNHVLAKNQSVAQNSEDPRAKIIAENKYQEAIQRLRLLAQDNKVSVFHEVLEKHNIEVKASNNVQNTKNINSSENYLKFRENAKAEMLKGTGNVARLSPNESKNLRLLSKMIKWGRLENQVKLDQVTDKEKKDLEKFLFGALNNKEFNNRILAFNRAQIPQGIDSETIEFMKSFSYKSKYHNQFMRIVSKAENVANHLDHLNELPDENKLSLRDFGVLNQASDMAKHFMVLNKAGLIRNGHYLSILFDRTSKAKELIDEINDTLQKEMDRDGTYKSGDIAAWNSYKWQGFLIKESKGEVALMRQWITDIGHGSFIYRSKPDEEGVSKTMQSHIYGTYENEALDAQQIAFSDIWRMNISKLTDTSTPIYKLLEQIYISKELNADEEIQKIYEEASREVHEDMKDNFKDMENEEARRFASGLADYGLKGGHKRKAPRTDNFLKVHAQFIKGPKNEGEKKWVICSEFVTKATIASLIETDARLVRVIEDYLKENADNPVVRTMAQELLKANEKEGMNFIDLPYDKSERLKRIHPGRMVQILHDKNCITKVDLPPTIKGIFTNETFNPGLKTKTFIEQKKQAENLISGGNLNRGLLMLDKMAKKGAPESYYAPAFAQFGLKVGEWSEITKQKTNIQDPFFNSNIHFTKLEIDGLRIIGKIDTDYTGKTKLTDEEKQTVMQFFAHIAQNQKFNQKIGEFAKVQGKHDSKMKIFNSNAFQYMREFSFKTNHLELLNELSPRFQKVWEAVRDKKEDALGDHEKITLNDYKTIDSFSNMSNFLSWANKLGLTQNSFLGTMKSQINGLEQGMGVVNKRFKEEVTYDTGDIIMDVMEKAKLYESKPFDPFNKVDWLLKVQQEYIGHQFQHAALAIKKDGNIEMAEIDLAYQKPIVEVGRLCIANVYRLDLSKMIRKRGLAHLRQIEMAQGEKDLDLVDKAISKQVNDKFKSILSEVMSNDELFKEISTSAFRQVMTVVRSKNGTPNDLSQLGFGSPQEIICSEFVARVYGHVIYRLNKEMQLEIKKNLIQQKGVKEGDAEKLAKNIQVLENPILNTNFGSVHVDNLYDLFEQYLQRVEPPNFMKKIQVSV